MSYYVIIPYSYMMRMLYEKEVFLLLVVFGVGTQQARSRRCYKEAQVLGELVELNLFFSSHSQNTKPTYSRPKRNNSERETCKLHKQQSMCSSYRSAAAVHEFTQSLRCLETGTYTTI